jgi:cell fate regulator YaaT (PSP1 superfamily)
MPIAAGLVVRRIRDKIFAETGQFDVLIGESVVVETEHGQEVGIVVEREKMIDKPKDPLSKVLRKLTKEDEARIAENELKDSQAHKIVMQKAEDHELAMKLTATQYTFDRSKLFIYYTAENRVDFRELIKDLGHMLKTRIQMVQIGVRDEAKMIGGIGTCGRKLCCKSFLKEFSSVTIDMAKEQDLSLNTAKLSGLCGRLMCCLAYENECYKHTKKKLPKIGTKVHTPAGQGTVVGFNCLKEEVTVQIGEDNVKTFRLDQLSHTILDKIGL